MLLSSQSSGHVQLCYSLRYHFGGNGWKVSEKLLYIDVDRESAGRLSAQVDLIRPVARANADFTCEEPASSGKGIGSGGSSTCSARDRSYHPTSCHLPNLYP